MRCKTKFFPTPGVEPGPAGWKPAILAVRPRGIDVNDQQIRKYYTFFKYNSF